MCVRKRSAAQPSLPPSLPRALSPFSTTSATTTKLGVNQEAIHFFFLLREEEELDRSMVLVRGVVSSKISLVGESGLSEEKEGGRKR